MTVVFVTTTIVLPLQLLLTFVRDRCCTEELILKIVRDRPKTLVRDRLIFSYS